jgi:16S rRNA (adenine1518-N6/adenine1519-N6)-dimethyltransferase
MWFIWSDNFLPVSKKSKSATEGCALAFTNLFFICYNLKMKEIRAKKSLGQNFLKNKKVLQKIVEVSELSKKDLVLEVGPGKGALTEKILDSGARVLVIEKDHRMIPLLEQKFAEQISSGQLEIFEGDALEMDYKSLGLVPSRQVQEKKFKIIANLPYYITGKFLSNVLSFDIQPDILVLMLQKAVVERIVLQKKNERKKFKENLLSLSVKIYGEPEFVMPVSAKNFSPVPKVDSAVLKVSKISKNFFTENKINEKDFFSFLKFSFSSKRKKMIKNLVEKKFAEKENLENIFQDSGIDINIRAEDLSIDDFKNIYLKLC